jgi:Ni/Fe-hydrogenase subunit HybB-like protein
MSAPFAPPADLGALQRKAWIVGLVAAAAALVGLFVDRQQFFRSYLVAWLLCVGVAVGCYAVALLHQMSRGAWGLMIRRPLGAASRTMPYLLIGFLPVVVGLPEIYSWARPGALDDPLIAEKAWYLNSTGFVARGVLYFAVWIGFAWILNRLSRRQDEAPSDRLFRRMQAVAAPALVLYVLTATAASVDWLMSLDPHWYSSLFGMMFVVSHGVSGLAFVILVALYLSQREPMREHLQPRHFHDYGKLLLAFVMLWTYLQLSQLIIVWSGNIPEEVTFYINRTQGDWKWLSIGLVLGHFALPFVLLLSRDLKRDARKLARVAGLLLVMRWFDIYWLAAPAFTQGTETGLRFHWLDLATVLAVGGVWFALYLRALGRRPLLPVFEPYLKEALGDD